MKICWDNLENIRYSYKTKKWYCGNAAYIYKNSCKNCGEPFLARENKKGLFCSNFCSNIGENGSMYGKHHTDETKLKISKNHPDFFGKNNPFFGKHHSNKTKRKLSDVNTGKKHTDNTKSKISESLKGRKHSEEAKKKMSELKSGKNHPGWKGGIAAEPYCDVWLDKEFKESIKERDCQQCLNPTCSGESKQLCIHHINYIKKDCSPFNLITVCKSCNTKANKDREWHEAWYNAIIYNRYKAI